VRTALTFGALLALLSSGCTWMQQPCGCGESFETDPWTEDELGIGASHSVSAHCLCRCGDGPVVLEDPSARCDHYEGDCTTATGEPAEYVCD